MKEKRGRKLKRHILTAFLITVGIFYSPFLIVNNSGFQKWFLNVYHPFSPWKVEFKSLRLRPWPPRVRVRKLVLTHPKGHQILIRTINVRPGLWRLFRGQLGLSKFVIDAPTVTFAKTPKISKEEKKKGFKLRTLLLLQNLLLKDAKIKNLTLKFPNEKEAFAKLILLDLSPSLRGGMKLGLDLQNVAVKKEGREKAKIEKTGLHVRTDFSKWSKDFPHMDDVDGTLQMEKALFGNWQVPSLEAQLRLEKNRLLSKNFSLQIKDNLLLGKWECHLVQKTFSLELNTPKAIAIPEIDSNAPTFDVAGDLNLNLQLEGKGFKLKNSKGKGLLKATHVFKNLEDHPAQVSLNFEWENGFLRAKEALVSSDDANIKATGGFHFSPPSLDLEFEAEAFPLQRFFEKFNDTNMRLIHGLGKFQGTVKGLGKTIQLKISGEATEGGYGPLQAQKALVDLEINHDQLQLHGKILNEDKETGRADFTIDYGPKQKNLPRPKKIFLNATLAEYPLEILLPDFSSSGLLNANFKLSGPQKQMEGFGKLEILNAELFGVAFENAVFPIQLTPQKLVIQEAKFIFPNTPVDFIGPVTFHFQPGGFLFSGNPLEGLKMEIAYLGRDKKWEIKKFQYKNQVDPTFFAEFQGTVSPESMNLRGKGKIDLKVLSLLNRGIREGEGPMTFDLTTHGTLSSPAVVGSIRFENNLLSLRIYPLVTEELTGTIQFKGNRIETESLKGLWGSGSFEMKGGMTHEQWVPKSFDMMLNGNQIYFRDKKGKFRMEYDAKLALKGAVPNTKLQGAITILDGKYTKDFNIIEEIKAAKKPSREILKVTEKGFPLNLDLQVRNLGDLTIDNNIGKIELATNLRITGTRFEPRVDGSISVTEGVIHYLGLDFEITRGLIEFRDPYTNPYLEIEAEQEVADAHITAKLHGRTDNLSIDLEGNSATLGPLDKKDVVSLVLFGMTTTERREQAQFQQFELGPELAAEQIAHALQRPVAKWAHIDMLKLESKPSEEGRIRRFYLGKKISDRVNVEFASELEQEDALQTFALEYWLTDFFIFKGARAGAEDYQLHLGFRLQAR